MRLELRVMKMTTDKAINELGYMLDCIIRSNNHYGVTKGHEAIAMAIESLEREKWFPYPEIKPDDIPENYLVTIKEGNNYHVAKRRWKDDKWLRWLHKGEIFIPKNFEGTNGVIAWKPLPDPYRDITNENK